MKINYLANIRVPSKKAHARQIIKMCEKFSLNHVDVSLIVPNFDNNFDNIYDYYGVKNIFVIKKIKSFDFFKIKFLSLRFLFYIQKIVFLFKLFFLKFDKENYIYTRDQEIAFLFKLKGYKVAYECHNYQGRKKFLLNSVDKFITTNENIKNKILQENIYKGDVLVVPNGVDVDIFNLNLSKDEAIKKLDLKIPYQDKKILVYSGRFKTKGMEKGIKEIIKSLRLIDDNNIIFVAVGGDESDLDYYNHYAKRENVLDRVFLYQYQAQSKLALFHQIADVLLMPFPKIGHYERYMTPLKMFEYMASGRMIISSDLESVRGVLNKNNCIFCKPDDVEDLANKIEFVLNEKNKDKIDLLVKQALSDVKNYTWSNRVEKILNFLY